MIYGDITYDELVDIILYLEQELTEVGYEPIDN